MKALIFTLTASACTTLGPMPGTTGVAAVPAGRPGIEVQAGIMPGYYLSQATESDQRSGQVSNQLSVAVEPDRLLGIPGLIVGARAAGDSGDRPVEPFVGYRTKLDDAGAISLGGVVYGTEASASHDGADYHATRFGGELAIDARVIEIARLLAIHAQAAAAITSLSASGHYCVGSDGHGADCDSTPPATPLVNARLAGAFPTATLTIAVDAGRRPTGFVQSARLAFLAEAGTMPVLVEGMQHGSRAYQSFGLTFTVGLGADR